MSDGPHPRRAAAPARPVAPPRSAGQGRGGHLRLTQPRPDTPGESGPLPSADVPSSRDVRAAVVVTGVLPTVTPLLPVPVPLRAEHRELVELARASLVASAAPEGAAVRDDAGRTFVAASVDLPSLRLTALEVAVAMAVTAGATALHSAAVVTEETEAPAGVEAVRDLGATATVLVARPDGSLLGVVPR